MEKPTNILGRVVEILELQDALGAPPNHIPTVRNTIRREYESQKDMGRKANDRYLAAEKHKLAEAVRALTDEEIFELLSGHD